MHYSDGFQYFHTRTYIAGVKGREGGENEYVKPKGVWALAEATEIEKNIDLVLNWLGIGIPNPPPAYGRRQKHELIYVDGIG